MSAKQYFDNLDSEQLSNVDVIVNSLVQVGITNKFSQSAILSICAKESNLKPSVESSYKSTSTNRIRKIFPNYVSDLNDDQIEEIKKDDIRFFDKIYGILSNRERDSNGHVYGNSIEGDGYKYRGRGFNQLTFKSNYKKIGDILGLDLVNNPDILNEDISSASKVLIQYYITSFKSAPRDVMSAFGVNKSSTPIQTINNIDSLKSAVQCFYQSTAGWGGWRNKVIKYEQGSYLSSNGDLVFPSDPIGGYSRARNLAPLFYEKLNGELSKEENAKSQDPPQVEIESPVQQSNSEDQPKTPSTSKEYNSKSGQIDKLTQFFGPKISPTEISMDVSKFSSKDLESMSKGMGFIPFLWYNGVQISYTDISSFTLKYKDDIPVINLIFKDTFGIMREDGFPMDDSIITVFINSRSKSLRSIKMDFKILSFKDFGSDEYSIIGSCDIPKLYIRKFESISNSTSHESLRHMSRQIDIGFCSNVENTNDRMSWIRPGSQSYDFIVDLVKKSYMSDSSFFYHYIDFYYNLCFVDISKELNRDVSNDFMINSFGYSDTQIVSEEISEKEIKLILTTDKSFESSVGYIEKFEILNNSTKISLDNAYRINSKIYNSNQKEILIFELESQTSDGEKSIILKGKPDDQSFFKENVNNIWLGKQDIDNVHSNYNYSEIQNRINLDEITKIGAVLTLSNPNFNLNKFQKIPVIFSIDKQTPSNTNQFLKRLTGDWFITDIEFNYDGGRLTQKIRAIKTELSMTDDEKESSVAKRDSKSKGIENIKSQNSLTPSDSIFSLGTQSSPETGLSV